MHGANYEVELKVDQRIVIATLLAGSTWGTAYHTPGRFHRNVGRHFPWRDS